MSLRIGISACLLGDPVRWDGSEYSFGRPQWLDHPSIELVGICPEVSIGMGVPRPPIQLVRMTSGVRAVAVGNPKLDYTTSLEEYADQIASVLQTLDGYVFTEKSPSCGVRSVKVFDRDWRKFNRTGRGVFSNAVLRKYPGMPVADARDLHDPKAADVFKQRVREYRQRLCN